MTGAEPVPGISRHVVIGRAWTVPLQCPSSPGAGSVPVPRDRGALSGHSPITCEELHLAPREW